MLAGVGCRFLREQDRLDHLLELSRFKSEGSAIATWNYDILVEEALGRSGRSFRYVGLQEGSDLPIYNVHGSVNWIQIKPYGRSHSLEVAQKTAGKIDFREHDVPGLGIATTVETGHEYVPPGGRANTILEWRQRSTNSVVLAT